jgi:hypothetical protein
MFWRKEKSLASAGIQTPGHPTHNLVTTLAVLFQEIRNLVTGIFFY